MAARAIQINSKQQQNELQELKQLNREIQNAMEFRDNLASSLLKRLLAGDLDTSGHKVEVRFPNQGTRVVMSLVIDGES